MSKKMKSTLVVAIALVISTSFISCSNAQKNNHEILAEVTTSSTKTSKEQAQKVLSSYLEIKQALVQTDSETASTAAQSLITALGESKDELVGKIRFDAEHIAETKDAGHQRDHFNTLSDNVYAMVKATGFNAYNLYRQYCPMAMDGEGAYWLSAEKEVNNPYFGDKMLHCGSVKETIKGN